MFDIKKLNLRTFKTAFCFALSNKKKVCVFRNIQFVIILYPGLLFICVRIFITFLHFYKKKKFSLTEVEITKYHVKR